jgi:solute carrier family 13 (sodium-dependent dicarboxylate transporter), member 2/3/5
VGLTTRIKVRNDQPSHWRSVLLLILLISILGASYFLPTPEGLSRNGQMMIGIMIIGGILWITELIPLAATGILIIIIQPILGTLPAEEVFSAFGNQAIFFLIGAFILAAAIEKYGLHRRLALRLLSFFVKKPRMLSLGIMASCTLLSFIIPEHGVAALFLPIVTSILLVMKVQPRQSNFGKVCMLSIAYGCSIGSLGTLVGGARNPLTITMLSNLNPPITVTFLDWMVYSMPVVFITFPLVWIILNLSFPIEVKTIENVRQEIAQQQRKTGRLSGSELTVIGIVAVTVILWIFFTYPPYFGLAVIALTGSLLLFFTKKITWRDVEERVPWGIILLYGGAITLGVGIQKTGAGAWIAYRMFESAGNQTYLVILGLIVLTIILTEFMSNVAAVAILLPIGMSIATEIPGISPLLAAMIIGLSGGLAFMLVISTPGNAIAYSSGYFSTRDLLRAGVISNICCICIIFVVAVMYWKGVLGL